MNLLLSWLLTRPSFHALQLGTTENHPEMVPALTKLATAFLLGLALAQHGDFNPSGVPNRSHHTATANAGFNSTASLPYGDPFTGPCNPNELNMSVNVVPGLYCAPQCDNLAPQGCGTTKPSGIHASPECIIAVNGSENNYCALVCQTYDAKSCDVAAGAECFSVGGVTGVCAFAN